MELDFSRCRDVWVPPDPLTGKEGFWSPPPPHVRYGVEQIVKNPFFMLADDMGVMKTAQSIIAAQFLHDMGEIDRVIVVAPAAVRPKVWFDQDLGQLREQVFNDKRNVVIDYHSVARVWAHGPETARELKWIVTNYEFIRNKVNLGALVPYCDLKTMLILDESSAVRSHDSIQTEACMILRWQTNKNKKPIPGLPRCGRILELNGTPIAESPMDMFSQGNLMHPKILECRFVSHYTARYAIQVNVRGTGGQILTTKFGKPIQTVDSWTNLEDLQKRFAPYVLRREAKSLGIDFALPPVGLEVRLTEKTWKVYRDMRNEMVAWLESGVAVAQMASIKTLRLAQITSGFVGGVEAADFDDPTPVSTVVEIGREKLDFALQWHKELLKRYPNLKLLTWCRFVPELKRYLAEVKKFGHPVGALCGQEVLGQGSHERENALRLLHPKTAPPDPATVGATQGTGAIGLNLTACRTVLDMSYDFSSFKKKQGDARVNRPGQTGPVSFFYLVAVGPQGQKTIDHHIMMERLGKIRINDWTTAAWVKALNEE